MAERDQEEMAPKDKPEEKKATQIDSEPQMVKVNLTINAPEEGVEGTVTVNVTVNAPEGAKDAAATGRIEPLRTPPIMDASPTEKGQRKDKSSQGEAEGSPGGVADSAASSSAEQE